MPQYGLCCSCCKRQRLLLDLPSFSYRSIVQSTILRYRQPTCQQRLKSVSLASFQDQQPLATEPFERIAQQDVTAPDFFPSPTCHTVNLRRTLTTRITNMRSYPSWYRTQHSYLQSHASSYSSSECIFWSHWSRDIRPSTSTSIKRKGEASSITMSQPASS